MRYGDYYDNGYGQYKPMGVLERLKMFFKNNSALRNLLVINIAVAAAMLLLAILLRVVYLFTLKPMGIHDLFPWLACPADVHTLLVRPWTLVTSLFVHAGFGHLFMNMLMLYIAGKYFQEKWGSRQLVWTYLLGGILGNLFYISAYQLIPGLVDAAPEARCVGASGAIMAVLFAVLIYQPNKRIQIFPFYHSSGIAMKWIALILVAIDLLWLLSAENIGGHISHLGGAVYGSVYALLLRGGIHFPKRTTIKQEKKKKKKFYTASQSQRPMSDAEFNAQKRRNEERVDEILDKISKDGYGALTKEEKDFLYHYKR